MMTCKSLYRAGLPLLLEDVKLSEPGDLDEDIPDMFSFCSCIMVDPTLRGPMVRTLIIITPESFRRYRGIIGTFSKVLRELKNVKELTIGSFGGWLLLDRSMMTSLLTLRNINSLSLGTARPDRSEIDQTIQTLEAMHSPIKTFNFQRSSNHNFFKILRNFSSTLESLSLLGVNLDREDVIYSQLKSLTLRGYDADMISVETLVACVPNLQSLLLGQVFGPYNPSPLQNSFRDRNISSQLGNSWSHLDLVDSHDVKGHYTLGLQCPVRHVCTRKNLHFSHDLSMWKVVIQDTQPSAITVGLEFGDSTLNLDVIPTLISDNLRSNITHLTLEVDVTHLPKGTGVEDALVSILFI